MKLQISFDLTDLESSSTIATHIAPYADIVEVGTILIYKYGVEAIKQFKRTCPHTVILADTKIVDRAKEVIDIFADAGADWVTVMAGTSTSVIHTATTAAHNKNSKVMLDLIDASSIGQSALEAKNLGVDALLFHQPYSDKESLIFLDKWDMIKGNTTLPIFVSAKIDQHTIANIIAINPDGIIVGESITESDNPAQEAHNFAQLLGKM